MLKCAIMQPTYLPWAGYFALMREVDFFVFYDDVQYVKRSWHSRNRILVNGSVYWLTVPIKHVSSKQLLIDSAIDDDQLWREKHVKTIFYAYSKHPFYDSLMPILSIIQSGENKKLVDLNVEIIKYVAKMLDFKCNFSFSSDIPASGKKSKYLINICNAIGCDQYYSPMGSKEYIEEEAFFRTTEIQVSYQTYVPQAYSQYKNKNFVGSLSFIDVLANIGWDGLKMYVCSKGLA